MNAIIYVKKLFLFLTKCRSKHSKNSPHMFNMFIIAYINQVSSVRICLDSLQESKNILSTPYNLFPDSLTSSDFIISLDILEASRIQRKYSNQTQQFKQTEKYNNETKYMRGRDQSNKFNNDK